MSLSSEQRTQVTRAFSSVHVAPLTNVNFDVHTGVVLPATVTLHSCPADVIRIIHGLPECRFVVVKDKIVIVEPSSRRIVTVIHTPAEQPLFQAPPPLGKREFPQRASVPIFDVLSEPS